MKTHIKRYLNIIFILTLLSTGTVAIAQEDKAADNLQNIGKETPPPQSNPVLYPLRFITNIISRADGDRCPMYPTCSAYSLEAFKKHGFLKGWIMTSDRLMRCGRDERKHSKPIFTNNEKHVYDPVSNNDFWW